MEGLRDPLTGTSVNLSETGMLVRTSTLCPRGTRVGFQLADVTGKGEVIWTRQTEEGEAFVGLRFLSLGRRDRKSLTRILAASPPPEDATVGAD